MCVITTTAAAAVTAAVSLASAAAAAAIGLSEVSAQKKTAEFQIEQAQKEAKNAEMQAAYERQEGVEEARKKKLDAILKMGAQKSKLAAGNISMSSDLVLNLENDAKINSELDALTTQKNAERRAQSYIAQSQSLYSNAALMSFNSKLDTNNAYLKLGGSIGSSAGFIGKTAK